MWKRGETEEGTMWKWGETGEGTMWKRGKTELVIREGGESRGNGWEEHVGVTKSQDRGLGKREDD